MKDYDEYLDDSLRAFDTHMIRLKAVVEKVLANNVNLAKIHKEVSNILVYYGKDLDAHEFVDLHNQTVRILHNSIDELGETLQDIGNDVVKTMEIHAEMLEELRREVDEYKAS